MNMFPKLIASDKLNLDPCFQAVDGVRHRRPAHARQGPAEQVGGPRTPLTPGRQPQPVRQQRPRPLEGGEVGD